MHWRRGDLHWLAEATVLLQSIVEFHFMAEQLSWFQSSIFWHVRKLPGQSAVVFNSPVLWFHASATFWHILSHVVMLHHSFKHSSHVSIQNIIYLFAHTQFHIKFAHVEMQHCLIKWLCIICSNHVWRQSITCLCMHWIAKPICWNRSSESPLQTFIALQTNTCCLASAATFLASFTKLSKTFVVLGPGETTWLQTLAEMPNACCYNVPLHQPICWYNNCSHFAETSCGQNRP